MKALALPIEMRNAIVRALGECPNKYVGAPVNWLMSLETIEVQVAPGLDQPPAPEETSDIVSRAKDIVAQKQKALDAMSAAHST